MADKDPPKEKNRATGNENFGQYDKRKSAAHKRSKQVPPPSTIWKKKDGRQRTFAPKVGMAGQPGPADSSPSGAATPPPSPRRHVDEVGAVRRMATTESPILGEDTDGGSEPNSRPDLGRNRRERRPEPLGDAPAGDDVGDVPVPPPLPGRRDPNGGKFYFVRPGPSIRGSPSVESMASIVRPGTMHYLFSLPNSDEGRADGELLLQARTMAYGGPSSVSFLQALWWFILPFIAACGAYYVHYGYHWWPLPMLLIGLVVCVLVTLDRREPDHAYKRTISWSFDSMASSHSKFRVYSDQSRDPALNVAPLVRVNLQVENVYWQGRTWAPPTSTSEMEDASIREDYMPRSFVVPHQLWASVTASISRLAERAEDQVLIAVDQAVRSMRAHVPLDYQAEFDGLTGDVSVAAIHAYRAMRYRISENLTAAHK